MERLDTLHASVYGLHKAGLLEADAVGDCYRTLLDDPIHDPHILGKTASGGLESCRAADFLVGLALRERLRATVIALAAGDVVENHDTIADAELPHALTDTSDYS